MSKWLEGGVPADRVEQVADVQAITDLLVRHVAGDRIAAVVRRRADGLDGMSLIELVSAGRGRQALVAWRTLYLNEDVVTARISIDRFIGRWPYEPEDLRADARPHLAVVRLPRNQDVADAHTRDGVDALGLPATYPQDTTGTLVPHDTCQHIGEQVRAAGLRGVRCRSAQAPHGAGRELAWFPATSRSRARLVERLAFADWFWG